MEPHNQIKTNIICRFWKKAQYIELYSHCSFLKEEFFKKQKII